MDKNVPKLFHTPFAGKGDAADIPQTNTQELASKGRAAYDTGFPPLTRTPKSAGGIPPKGVDFNGILKDTTANLQYIQAGMHYPFDQAFCGAIGGYPKGAILIGADMKTLWRSEVDNNITDPDASSSSGWIEVIDIATPSDITAGTAGKLVDAAGLRKAQLGAIIGEIRLLPFRATELPVGWYHADGSQHAVDSSVGKALKSLPAGYKEDWKIVEQGGMINVPNMYHEDGRAYFPRAGSTPAVVQEDAIRNIEGTTEVFYGQQFTSGVFSSLKAQGSNQAGSGSRTAVVTFNASNVVPTAEENRPLNISFVPAIYLGV